MAASWVVPGIPPSQYRTQPHPGYTLPRGSAVLHHGYTRAVPGVNIAVGLRSVAQLTCRAH